MSIDMGALLQTLHKIEIGIDLFEKIQNQYEVATVKDGTKHLIFGIETSINYDKPKILRVGYLETTTLGEWWYG